MLEFFAFLALGGFTFITWLDAREAKAEALRARADLNRLLIFLTGLSPSGVARKVEATPIEPAASFSSAPENARAPKANPWQTGKTEVEPVVAAVSEAVAPEPEITPIVVAAVPSQPIEQKAAPASLPRPDVEQSFATRWAVWIGGAALSLGGLLIVKYSIEAGYFGPSVRLVLGAAFALALAFASEFIRRHDLKLPDLGLATQHIPAMLAGISVLSGLAVIYSAYALYGFIGAELAFALLAVLGLAAISVSLLHGPYFGLFGLVSSYLTPILVSTGKAPNYVALVAFFSVVTVAGLLIERLRPSKQLLLGAVIGHALWTALIALGTPGEVWGSLMLGIAILIAVIRVEMVRNHAQEHKTEQRHAPLHLLAPFVVPLVLGGALWVEQGGEVLTRLALLMPRSEHGPSPRYASP